VSFLSIWPLGKRPGIGLVGVQSAGDNNRVPVVRPPFPDEKHAKHESGKQVANTMHDKGHKKYSSGGATREAATKEAERRGADRHIFTASAEVIDMATGARFSTRTTDLGPGGCFVDTLSPLPIGSQVHVSVRKGQTHFQCEGAVVYSQDGLGMGIGFESLDATQRAQLDTWLNELTGGRYIAPVDMRRERRAPKSSSGDHAMVVRLVQLLVGKGLLTEAEGQSVLHDPVL
jgi:PilZ domain